MKTVDSDETKRVESSRLPLSSLFLHSRLHEVVEKMKEKMTHSMMYTTYRIKIHPDISSSKNENLKDLDGMYILSSPTLAISCPSLTA